MIKAKRKPVALDLFRFYVRVFLAKRSFANIYVRVDKKISANQPSLIIANHSSWWDGMIALLLTKNYIKQPLYMMMSEKGLQTYSFFRYFGAFSINPTKPKEMMASLHYAKEQLQNRHAVWLFPQGEEQALEKRPLDFSNGIGWLCEHAPSQASILPVTISYVFADKRKPNVFIHIGSTHPVTSLHGSKHEKTVQVEKLLTTQLDKQRETIIQNDYSRYTVLH
ncbi:MULTISPECIES: lysophospholipid acyltransferase family protein [Shouchella]|uniref:Lysophospholipid acyltransferase family protein n=2 Tax=Shouchella TaxID=2893057 RepID=A0ABY7W5I8_9BACI|nr:MULTISPECIES: lysophospholipid acyltransferase family protein [Shouchella]MED4127985.1 lysophospholipid acyltransferase family protein [Shouchella miscanthi]WDF03130.1 lysophospholipid acyltransferase family protein [Shouchella hunanensis]